MTFQKLEYLLHYLSDNGTFLLEKYIQLGYCELRVHNSSGPWIKLGEDYRCQCGSTVNHQWTEQEEGSDSRCLVPQDPSYSTT